MNDIVHIKWSVIIVYYLLHLFAQFGVLFRLGNNLKILILFEYLMLFLLVLLEFLIHFVFFLNELDNFTNPRPIQYSMHGRISKISQQKRNHVKQNDIYVTVAHLLCFDKSFFDFLENKEINFI